DKIVFHPQRKFNYTVTSVRLIEKADIKKIKQKLKLFYDSCDEFEKYLFDQKKIFELKGQG
ncbi:hypothetical protein ACFL6W_10620, partial [Thermodesulfobacteriota bacterium]